MGLLLLLSFIDIVFWITNVEWAALPQNRTEIRLLVVAEVKYNILQ